MTTFNIFHGYDRKYCSSWTSEMAFYVRNLRPHGGKQYLSAISFQTGAKGRITLCQAPERIPWTLFL
jgi:hypothetical protein